LIQLFHDNLLYDHSSKKWYWRNAHYWDEDLIEDVIGSIDGVIDLYKQEVLNQAKLRTVAVSSGKKEKKRRPRMQQRLCSRESSNSIPSMEKGQS
jgi:hypothetical protein